mgnify:FL=1
MKVMYSRSNTIGSWLIRLCTFSKWSHVAVLIDEFSIIDSTAKYGGVKITSKEVFKSTYEFEVYDIELPDEEAAISFLFSQIGKKYDWTSIFGMIFQRNWQEDDRWFCSELLEAACVKGGKQRFRDEVYRITPHQSWAVK